MTRLVRSMRMRFIALAVLVPALTAAAPWPPEGLCIPPWPSKPASACIQVAPADAKAIQRLMVTFATKRGAKKAKALAQRAITEWFIGSYAIRGYEHADYKGETLKLLAVESSAGGMETGFKFVVGRDTP